jgi:hypothetical protein
MILTRRITDALDDTYTEGGSTNNVASFVSFGKNAAGAVRDAGLIFRNITIPKGSTITNAYITFLPYSTRVETTCNLKFIAQASSNPPHWEDNTDFYARSLETAEVDWNNVPTFTAGTYIDSPDISSIIQEIINRSDWVSGGGINIFIKDNGSDTGGRRDTDAFDLDVGNLVANITIEYNYPPTKNFTRVILPGYDALTDTNPDHYSLLADEDNVLIKKFAGGTETITDGNPTEYTLAHNLGYIPFYVAFCDDANNGIWSIINNQYNPFSVPSEISGIDVDNLRIWNFGGHASGNLHTAYDIFYEDMSNDGSILNTTGYKNPASVVNDNSNGGTVVWIHAGYAEVVDGAFTAAEFVNTPGTSEYLKATGFGFNIPSNATILGVLLKKTGYFSGSGAGTSSAKLVVGGSVSGNNRDLNFGSLGAYISGDTTDLWGNTLTPSIVNNSNFGVALYTVLTSATNAYVNVDGIELSIFYTVPSGNTTPSITETKPLIKIAKSGVDAKTSKNPNDYIMHSNLNNFKILKQGKVNLTLSASGGGGNFSHGADVDVPYKFFALVKFPDGKTLLTGGAPQLCYDESVAWIASRMDSTKIYIDSYSGSDVSVEVYYLIYGTGKDNTIVTGNPELVVAAPGKDAKNETNPDNFNFHSSYPTLKYYASGSYAFQASNTTVIVIAHNLDYVPFHIGFVNDLLGFIPNSYCIVPFYWGRSTIADPNKNIGAFMYADATNIYLKAWFQATSGNPTVYFDFHYKLFKNNLGF